MNTFTKCTIAALLTLVVTVSSHKLPHQPRDLEQPTLAFIECVRQSLDGGLESADIPDHNPFVSWRTIDVPVDFLTVSGNITLHDMLIRDIVDFEVTQLDGVLSEDGNSVLLTYELSWWQMRCEGEWHGVIHEIFGDHDRNGTISINFKDLHFRGFWNMTLPGDDRVENLDTFEVSTACSTAEVKVVGLGDLTDETVDIAATDALTAFVNDLFPVETVSGALQNLFNTKWLSNATRIDAIMDNCQLTK